MESTTSKYFGLEPGCVLAPVPESTCVHPVCHTVCSIKFRIVHFPTVVGHALGEGFEVFRGLLFQVGFESVALRLQFVT